MQRHGLLIKGERPESRVTLSNISRYRQMLTCQAPAAQNYLDRLGMNVEDLFHHVIAVLHNPQYRAANAGALRMEWPRIPLPGWPDGSADGAAAELSASSARGRQLAALLDSDTPVAGVTSGALTPAMAAIAVPAIVQKSGAEGDNMAGDDFAVTAGWGHYGSGDAVMPGQGRIIERDYTALERAALSDTLPTLGETTCDTYLNDRAYWRNVPAAVWNYQLGGYQVLKKWLSYREQRVLSRALTVEEVQTFAETARRVAEILVWETAFDRELSARPPPAKTVTDEPNGRRCTM